MKKTILLAMLAIGMIAHAQFERSTVQTRLSTFTSPGSRDDGYSQGIQFNANFSNGIYVSPTVYVFPDLRGTDYFHIGSEIGYNVFYNNTFRMYSGVFLGGVIRHYKEIGSDGIYFEKTATTGTFAVQAGVEWQLGRSPFFVGAQSFCQYRTDPGNEDNYWRFNGFVSIGIILN